MRAPVEFDVSLVAERTAAMPGQTETEITEDDFGSKGAEVEFRCSVLR
jgi:hypothetical protein